MLNLSCVCGNIPFTESIVVTIVCLNLLKQNLCVPLFYKVEVFLLISMYFTQRTSSVKMSLIEIKYQ